MPTGRHLDRLPHRLAAERTLEAPLRLLQKLVIKAGHGCRCASAFRPQLKGGQTSLSSLPPLTPTQRNPAKRPTSQPPLWKRSSRSLHCRFKPGEGSFHGLPSASERSRLWRRRVLRSAPSRSSADRRQEQQLHGPETVADQEQARVLQLGISCGRAWPSSCVCVSSSADAALTLHWAQCTTPPSV